MKQSVSYWIEHILTVTGLRPGVRLLVAPESDSSDWYFNEVVDSESVKVRVRNDVQLIIRMRHHDCLSFEITGVGLRTATVGLVDDPWLTPQKLAI